MKTSKNWNIYNPDPELTKMLSSSLGITSITAGILANRGIKNIDEARCFLNPSFSMLHNPFLLPDMEKAVKRINQALESREKLLVYGDTDVDGIAGTAILVRALRRLGARVEYYIPQDGGYGLKTEVLLRYIDDGFTLLISVDCGSSAKNQIEIAQGKGMDVIVTDHHEVPSEPPDAYALVNPKRIDSNYPFSEIAGCTVAFKLLWALQESRNFESGEIFVETSREIFIDEYVDLVALGTIADIVPMKDENRILAKRGLKIIADSNKPGIRALLRFAKIKSGIPGSREIAWTVTPLLNACGRMNQGFLACELFLADDGYKAYKIVERIGELNRQRKAKQHKNRKVLFSLLDKQSNLLDNQVIIIQVEGIEHGVTGIIASRLVERFFRPVIILIVDGEEAVGSARSVEGFNILEALKRCEHLLVRFGGHERAAGLTVRSKDLDRFRQEMISVVDNMWSEKNVLPQIHIDHVLNIEDATEALFKEFSILEPFGLGNPYPLFMFSNLDLIGWKRIGNGGEHLRLDVSTGDGVFEVIGFNKGDWVDILMDMKKVDMVFRFGMGNSKKRLILEDIKPADGKSLHL